jgi:hypothetical protein
MSNRCCVIKKGALGLTLFSSRQGRFEISHKTRERTRPRVRHGKSDGAFRWVFVPSLRTRGERALPEPGMNRQAQLNRPYRTKM